MNYGEINPMENSVYLGKQEAIAGQFEKEKHYWLNQLSGELVKSSFPFSAAGGPRKNKFRPDTRRFHLTGELFSRLGKSGGCIASHTEAISRLISLALRSGVEVEAILHQIKGIRCPSPSWYNGGSVLSCADGIGLALEEYLKERKKSAAPKKNKIGNDLRDICPECPDCGSLVEYVEGCVVCRTCGYSKCD